MYGCIYQNYIQLTRENANFKKYKQFLTDIKGGNILTDEYFVSIYCQQMIHLRKKNHSIVNYILSFIKQSDLESLFSKLTIVYRIYLSTSVTNYFGERSFSI